MLYNSHPVNMLQIACHFFLGQWIQNAIKIRMFSCRRTPHTRPIHMIEWRTRIRGNVCPAHTSNTQRQVHMKNDVFKRLAVFLKLPFLREGKKVLQLTHFNQLILCLLLNSRCDVPRTPHRRTQEMPACSGGSRTAPRPMNSLNSSIVGIGKRQITLQTGSDC